MSRFTPGVGDTVEVVQHHRLAGSEGTIVAIADNPHARRPDQNYHIRFHRPTRGVIDQREVWLDVSDFVVLEKAKDDYVPPDDIAKPAAYTGE